MNSHLIYISVSMLLALPASELAHVRNAHADNTTATHSTINRGTDNYQIYRCDGVYRSEPCIAGESGGRVKNLPSLGRYNSDRAVRLLRRRINHDIAAIRILRACLLGLRPCAPTVAQPEIAI